MISILSFPRETRETTSHDRLYQTKNIEIDFKFKTVDGGDKRS